MRRLVCTVVLVACHPAAGPSSAEPPEENAAPRPIEAGVDLSWRDREGCKPTLDDRDQAFLDDYAGLCQEALSRVAICAHDATFLARWPDAPWIEDELAETLSPANLPGLCRDLAHDQFCGASDGTYFDAYSVDELRSLAAVPRGDCTQTGAQYPGPLGLNGGD